MPLSCSCSSDDFEWYFVPPDDYSSLQALTANCGSCDATIRYGQVCTKFRCFEMNEDGDELDIGPIFHCERCADLYFSLTELGFDCVAPDEDMRELVQEYAADYGPEDAK